jgi:hypothetical protein
MTSFASSLLAGVVSGFFVSIAVLFFRVYWLRVLQPWYENRLYQDAKIEGLWTTIINFPDGTTNTHRIALERVGYSISGSVVCISGYSEGQTYTFSGTFKNLLLTGSYQMSNGRSLERGTFTLMLVEGGARLRGHLTYYDNQAHSVGTAPCEWVTANDVINTAHNPAAPADQQAPLPGR